MNYKALRNLQIGFLGLVLLGTVIVPGIRDYAAGSKDGLLPFQQEAAKMLQAN